MALFQAVAIGLIALILAPGALFYFDVTPKLAVLLLATAILLPWAAARASRRTWLFGVLAYAASLILSASLSAHPGLSWFGSSWRRYGVVAQVSVILLAWVATTVPNRRVLMRAIAVTTAIASVYGIAQFAGFDPLLPAAGYHVGEGVWSIVRPPATFGYVSYFATWLAIASFLALALAAQEEGVAKIAVQGVAVIAGIALLFTGSRAAWLGLAAGGAVWIWHRGLRVSRRALGIAAGLVLVLGAFYFSPAGLQLRSRTRWFMEDPWGGSRLGLWRDSLRMGLTHPIFGFGPEGFTGEFPHYESVALAQAYPDFAHESPHNIFLDALISQGLPGLLLLGAFAFAGMRTALRAPHPGYAAALAAGLVSQQFTVFIIPTAAITFLAAALALEPEAPATGRPRWLPFTIAPVSLALLYCAIRFTVADASLSQASRELGAGRLHASADAYQRYSRWRFPGSSADLWFSRTVFESANRATDPATRIQGLVQSGVSAMQATGTAEDPFDAWYNLALMSAARNDAAGTERALRAAIAAHPNWFKPHWSLAQVLSLMGRAREAREEATLAIRLSAGKYPEVQRTLGPIVSGAAFQR